PDVVDSRLGMGLWARTTVEGYATAYTAHAIAAQAGGQARAAEITEEMAVRGREALIDAGFFVDAEDPYDATATAQEDAAVRAVYRAMVDAAPTPTSAPSA